MLSDAIRQTRERISSNAMPAEIAGILLTLRAYEIEARNMEDRIELLTGRPHTPIPLVSAPEIEVRQ